MNVVFTNSDNKITIEINNKYKMGDAVQFHISSEVRKMGIIDDIRISDDPLHKSNLHGELGEIRYVITDYNGNKMRYFIKEVDIIKQVII